MLICLWIWYGWEILGMSRNQNVKIQSNGIFHRQFKIFFQKVHPLIILPHNCEFLVLLFPAKHANLSHGLMPCYILGIFSVFTCKNLFGAKFLCFFGVDFLKVWSSPGLNAKTICIIKWQAYFFLFKKKMFWWWMFFSG